LSEMGPKPPRSCAGHQSVPRQGLNDPGGETIWEALKKFQEAVAPKVTD